MLLVTDLRNKILLGSCEDLIWQVPDGFLPALVTDPPYGLGNREPSAREIDAYLEGGRLNLGGDFMNKKWDIPSVAFWRECYRALEDGAYLVSFGGTRTYDLIGAGLLAAGFRWVAKRYWVQSQGMPKGGTIGKKIDQKAGATRKVVGLKKLNERDTKTYYPKAEGGYGGMDPANRPASMLITEPATEEAELWEGWGSTLKPAWEPIYVVSKGEPRRPLDLDTFLYCAKATKSETTLRGEIENDHPTKKPVELMRWLVRAVARPGDLVLDPYVGSGSTAEALVHEGMAYLGFERDPAFHKIADTRASIVLAERQEFDGHRNAFDLAMSLGDDE
jgi:DNA modification methylase